MCLVHDMSLPNVVHDVDGVHWHSNGQVGLSGTALTLWKTLEKKFVLWAEQFESIEHLFPSIICGEELQKIDYLQSFPQLVNFAATAGNTKEEIENFILQLESVDINKGMSTKNLSLKDILTPAACYHFYIHYKNSQLNSALYLSTQCTCFRNEEHFSPLRRQRSFTMRENVCIGGEHEVEKFIQHYKERISNYAETNNIKGCWKIATDPFYSQEGNEKYIAQKVFPVKQEFTLENGLAISSVNRHMQYFGEQFDIDYRGAPAYSACAAFGMERWLYAFINSNTRIFK